MKTYTLRSAWGKTSTKSIDLIDTSCILAIANTDLTLILFTTGAYFSHYLTPHCFIPPCAQSLTLCFINLTSGNLLRLKDLIDKMVLMFPSLFLSLFLTSVFLISVQ